MKVRYSTLYSVMHCAQIFFPFFFLQFVNAQNNLWNYEITKKNLLSFKYNGAFLSLWEDTRKLTRPRYYVTPLTELLPETAVCQFNFLAKSYQVLFDVLLWKPELADAAVLALRTQLGTQTEPPQINPLPIYKMRLSYVTQEPTTNNQIRLDSTWKSNLKESTRQQFAFITDSNETCHNLVSQIKANPQVLAHNLKLDIHLTGEQTAVRKLTVTGTHMASSTLFANLKNMITDSSTRFLQSTDLNKLMQETVSNTVAEEIVMGTYVPSDDQLKLKDLILKQLEFPTVQTTMLSEHQWESVFWDPDYARPDKITQFLNDVLDYDQGKKEFFRKKDSSLSTSNSFGIGELFTGSGSISGSRGVEKKDLHEWLRKHNYKVQFDGAVFRVKPLALKRLNILDLENRQNIVSTSVQVRTINVENSMKLTVGTQVDGNFFIDSTYFEEKMKDLNQTLESLKQEDEMLKQKDQQISAKVEPLLWVSSNGYCILASGACPPGFTRSESHLRAISVWATSYIKSAHFGDSRITQHGHHNKLADFFLSVCCK